jgi:DNA-binding NarL/FixJ family response regulator
VSDRSPNPDFVGRTDELALFERAFASARDGVPSILLVGGDAGIGKSTLTMEAAQRAGVPLHAGRCVPMGGDVIPLAPLVDLLRQVRRIDPELLDRGDLLPLARWLDPSGAHATTGTGAGALFVPVLDVIAHLGAHGPVAVAVEDLHWADAVTWDLFEFLARNLLDAPVVLIGTYRASEVGAHADQRRRLAELTRLPHVHRIHLSGLNRDDVAARVTALLGATASHQVIEEILARGQGNPFFTEELVAAHASGEAIPVVLSDLISADITGLNDPARHVVSAMAVVGREVSHDLLSALVDLDDEAAEAAVRSAMDAQLVVVDPVSDAYRFRHALIGEVVYADLLPSQRTRLHRRVAQVLRQQRPEAMKRADRAGELAFHLDRAGDREGAFTALLAAADAAQVIAPGAAFAHLERAFALWDDAPNGAAQEDRGHRLWQAAELASATAGNDRAVEVARAAFAVGPPPQGAAWGHERLGRYLWASGQLEESRSEFEQAAALLTDDEPTAAPVFAGLGQAELMAGRYEVARGWCDRVFDVVTDPADDPGAWVMARRVLGIVLGHTGDPERGVELCRDAVAAAPTAQVRTLAVLYLGVALLDAGRSQEVVNVALDEVAAAQLAGLDHSFGGYLDALAAEAMVRLGRWAEADAALARHMAYDTLPVGVLRVARAAALLAARRGDADLAASLLADAMAQPVDGFHRSFADLTAAEVHLALGHWSEASRAAERGWEGADRSATLWAWRFATLAVAAAVEQALDALAAGQPLDDALVDRLTRRLDDITAQVETVAGGHPPLDASAHLVHARASLTLLTGPDPDAWSQAARRWEELGDRWWVAVATLREADAAASAGDAARAADALRAGHQLAAALGASGLVAQAEAISRRTRLSLEAPTRVTLDRPSIERLGLTAREAEVLALVAAGHTNRQIGEQLFVSEKTASVHVSNILRKLGVTSRVDAAAVAQRAGIA